MKARNFLMVVSALSIAGCSQNEVTEMRQDTNPVLGFNVYTGVPTRGTDVSTTTMQGTCDATHFGGFGIRKQGRHRSFRYNGYRNTQHRIYTKKQR